MSTMSLATLGCVSGGRPRRMMRSSGGGIKYACGPSAKARDSGFGNDDPFDGIDSMRFGSPGVESLMSMSLDADFTEIGSIDSIDPADAADRFSLEAADPLDRLIAILIAAAGGKFEKAQLAFYELKLTARFVRSWSPEQKAKANYFAIRLMSYGLKLSPDFMKILASASGSLEAEIWKELAKREMGMRSTAAVWPDDIASNPACGSFDGWQFIAWKLGRVPKPEIGPWALVP